MRGNPGRMALVICLVLLMGTGCHLLERRMDRRVLLVSDEVMAQAVYAIFDAEAEELLLVMDDRIWRVDLRQEDSAVRIKELPAVLEGPINRLLSFLSGLSRPVTLELMAESQATDYLLAGPPYLAYCEEGKRSIGVLRQRGILKVREFSDDATQTYTRQDAGNRLSEALGSQFFVPVMLRQQWYSFGVGDRWYRLDTEVEPDTSGTHTYSLRLYRLEKKPDGSHLGAPGYVVRQFDDGLSVWVSQPWADTLEWEELSRQAVDEACTLFGLPAGFPIHVVAGPGDDLVRPREISHWFAPYAQASVVMKERSILRHEILHGVHDYALKVRGHTLHTVPTWVQEGLAEYFGVLGTDDEALHALLGHRYAMFVPSDGVQSFLENPRLTRHSGLIMVQYLMEEFGKDRVVEYSTALRDRHGWRPEERLTGEYFGMTQGEILAASLQEPPALVREHPPPDRTLVDWNLLTFEAAEHNAGFTVCPRQERIAMITDSRTAIRVLDLETLETEQVFSLRVNHDLDVLGTLAWFPCGERMAFMAREEGGANDIYVLHLGDGSHEVLVASEAVDSGPHISPCGERLAFRSERTGHSELYVKDLGTSEISQLTREETHLVWPVWSENGEGIAFVDSQRERLGWLDLESDRIQWVDVSPHGVLVSSRPRWIGDNEVVFSAWIHRVGVAPLLVDLDSGELEVWGDLDLWANWVEPAGDNRFYACIMVWDPDARRLYNAVSLLAFARQE